MGWGGGEEGSTDNHYKTLSWRMPFRSFYVKYSTMPIIVL